MFYGLWAFADVVLGPACFVFAHVFALRLRVEHRTAFIVAALCALYLGIAGNLAPFSLSMYFLVYLGMALQRWWPNSLLLSGTLLMVVLVLGIPMALRALRVRLHRRFALADGGTS
jgi:hypothetical protein